MRYYVVLGLLSLAAFLSGCAEDVDGKAYLAGSHTSAPTKSVKGAQLKVKKQQYPVNVVTDTATDKQPSLAPPGQGFSDPRAEGQYQSHFDTQLTTGNSLKLPMPVTKAWAQVGRALGQTSYRVMDKDEMMHTYYVLDKGQTNNKITQKTPIYQIKVLSSGKQSELVVLNKDSRPVDKASRERILRAIAHNLESA